MALGFAECLSMKAECATFWAGWGVITTAGVGVVTVLVAVLAWVTSRRAAKIAGQAALIAEQQHLETVRVRAEDARIIGRLLFYEVDAAPHKFRALGNRVRRSINWGDDAFIISATDLRRALTDIAVPVFPGAEKIEHRIYNLPDALGADLATLIGGSRTLIELVRKIEPRVLLPSDPTSKIRYHGDTNDLRLLIHQLTWLESISGAFAAEFRPFVGVSTKELEAARSEIE